VCVYLRIYARAYLATLSPYGDNNKILVYRPMIMSSIPKLDMKYVFDKKTNKKEKKMAVMTSNDPSPFPFPTLWCYRPSAIETPPRLVPTGPFISWPKNPSCSRTSEQAAPLSRHDDERQHVVGSHSALALRLYLAACNPSASCRFWVLDHLCSNLYQSFHSC